jgi:hypothetical protein
MINSKYQLLPNTDRTPAIEVNLIPVARTQSLERSQTMPSVVLTEISLNENQQANNQDSGTTISVNLIPTENNHSSYPIPPTSELPSYNEALRLKKQEASEVPPSYYPTINNPTESRHIIIDESELRANDALAYDQDIGSECMFLSAFMIAFFFNWIGFFASICLLPNAAGKYGALSGFGLSMAKWVTIVRYQEWMNNMNDFQQKLFFWLFIFLGFYLFFRGLINYMSLKYRPRQNMIDISRERNRNRWFGFIE